MHEVTMCRSLLGIVLTKAAESRVNRVIEVSVQVGELRGIAAQYLSYYFDLLKKGTVAEGATLNVVPVSAALQCPACGTRFALAGQERSCPHCAGQNAIVVAGFELCVKSMRVE